MGKKSRNKSPERKDHTKKKSKKSKKSKDKSSRGSLKHSTADVELRLRRERDAVHIFRLLLSEYPAAKKELRQMIWKLDDGEAVDTAGVPDATLRQLIEDMFGCLGLKQLSQGYCRVTKGEKIISILAPVFELPPLPAGSATKYLASKHGSQPGSGKQASPAASPPSSNPNSSGDDSDAPAAKRHAPARDQPNVGSVPPLHADVKPTSSSSPFPSKSDPHDSPPADAHVHAKQQADSEYEGVDVKHESDASMEEKATTSSPPRRALGPMMPSAEVLAAAQEAAAEYEASGKVWRPGGGEEEDDDFIIGPIPPEMELEFGDVPQDERSQEVSRIMSVGRGANTKAEELDAYDVLGVAADAPVGEVKKRYWKLSLLIHPDKCSHPQADEAFKRLSLAAKMLQDASARSALDNKRMAAEMQKWEDEAAEQEERERQWRVVRGEEVDTGPARRGPTVREDWMLQLPEERRAPAVMSQVSVRSFGRNTTISGDRSGWTQNPLLPDNPGPALLMGTGAYASTAMLMGKEGEESGAAAGHAVGVVLTSGSKRTLLERHQDEIKAKKKKKDKDKSKDKTSKAAGDDGEWVGQHPWRPFDREKDLGPSLGKAKDAKDLLKGAVQLSNRFASGGAAKM